MKSVSSSELGVDEVINDNKKNIIKKTLKLSKNSFNNIGRFSRRRLRKRENNIIIDSNKIMGNEIDNNERTSNQNNNFYQDKIVCNGNKTFRKPSWKKMFSTIMQHVKKSNNNQQNIISKKLKKDDVQSSSINDIRLPSQKPSHIPVDSVPGVIGLRNHGNTCFINAVLQCLSHTDILAEYFVLDQYKADLSRRNKLNSKKYGTKGEITEQLALLLKAIWSCQYDPEMSTAFKSVVDKYGSQYRGNLQHDAQEFLLWLLDKVHEDLNQATKKNYKIIKVKYFI